MARFKTIDDLTLSGKTALVRVDLNVPMKGGAVGDATRIERILPTLRDLKAKGAKIVLLSHLGRPDGKADLAFSLAPVAKVLEKLWGAPVAFAADCVGPEAEKAVASLAAGDVLVLENTRFHPEEEANDKAFAAQLAKLGDVFINDAFSAAHRAHATTEGLSHFLPTAAGRLMEEEVTALSKALLEPARPLAALAGGAKISTKLALLENLVAKVDLLILGGGMANTFLAARGFKIGASLYEPAMLDTARAIDAAAKAKGCQILLPEDVVVATDLTAPSQTVLVGAIPEDQKIFDLGPASVAALIKALEPCKTLVWNGPLGVFETPPFDAATNALAKAVAARVAAQTLMAVAGGGDTVAALSHAGIEGQLSYVSTAGGAFLEWLEGKTLPGVPAAG